MMRNVFLLGALASPLAACAPSPLYIGQPVQRSTMGEIPRNAIGEPMWDAIPPAPLVPATRGMPAPLGAPIVPPR